MRATALLPLLATPAFADYTSDLVGTLNGLGLTSLVAAIQNASQTDGGKALIGLLSNTTNNFTVFAPNNQGFSGAHSNATSLTGSDPGLLNTLKYHVVAGSLANFTANFPNTTVGRTYLNASNLVELEGNKSQAIAWSTYGNTTYVMNQNTPTKVVNTATWRNLQVIVIDAVIDIPGDLSNGLDSNRISQLETVTKTVAKGALWTQLNNNAHGFTLFAPETAVWGNPEIQHTLEGLNETALAAVLGNHVVNGTTLYSSNLASGATSASGQTISALTNSSGTFITSANSTVRVVTPDVILKNGVMHVISGVLFNTQSNPAAASSAFQSATSAAGTVPATTETAPIGNTQTAGGASQSAGGNGAVSLGFSYVAVVVSVVGAVIGGMLTL